MSSMWPKKRPPGRKWRTFLASAAACLVAGGAAAPTAQDINNDYDYIVVGGGTVGCPLARTLADAGKNVLLIERGRARIDEPQTLDIYGAGIVIANREVAQPVVTTQGVRSHIGSVLGGGSSVNFAIAIQETDEYFDNLEKLSGVKFDRDLLQKSQDWARDLVARPMKATHYGDLWRRGLQQFYGPFRGSSPQLAIGSSWGGETGFEPSNNWFRRALDVALGIPGVDFPETLQVLVGHTVHRVEFDSSGRRALCVAVAPTTLADYDSIMPPRLPGYMEVPTFPLFRVMQRFSTTFSMFRIPVSVHRFCVKRPVNGRGGGDIIMSAGAILTPALLFKSGVGPIDKVRRARASRFVREVPELGNNLQDRAFIPIGLFFKDEFTDRGFPARVVQNIAIANIGEDCSTKQMWDKNYECSTVTAEELSGGRLAEGVIYATRYVAPPELRHDPFVDFLFSTLEDCAEKRRPMGRALLQPFCPLVEPVIRCFRKVAANLAFISETHSVGSIDVGPDGELIVDGAYLRDPHDLRAAIRGTSNLIKLITAPGLYDDIFEPAGLGSCPALVLNGIVSLLDNAAERSYAGPEGASILNGFTAETVENSAFRKYIQGELDGFQLKLMMMEADEGGDGELGEMERQVLFDGEDAEGDAAAGGDGGGSSDRSSIGGSRAFGKVLELEVGDLAADDVGGLGPASRSKKTSDGNGIVLDLENDGFQGGVVTWDSLFPAAENVSLAESALAGNADAATAPGRDGDRAGAAEGAAEAAGPIDELVAEATGQAIYPGVASAWRTSAMGGYPAPAPARSGRRPPPYATYPLNLPNPDDYEGVRNFVKSWMTSMWHWTGSAAMGRVVDERFLVKGGFENLRIVDASVLNRVTRMNPFITLAALGRYAGLLLVGRGALL